MNKEKIEKLLFIVPTCLFLLTISIFPFLYSVYLSLFQAKLTKMHKQNIDNFKKIEIELKKQEQDIISKKNILEKAELEKKLNELRKKSNDYRVDRKKKIDSLSKKRIDVTNNILKQLQPILTEYSDLESISLIVDKKSIVIGKTELDITDKIIELLNAKIKSVDLN